MATEISIITPWLNHPELIHVYEPSVRGAQVIIVDNGSQPHVAIELERMIGRLGGILIRNEDNRPYAQANNQGLRVATGEIVIFLNNDIKAPSGWLDAVRRDVKQDSLCGPSLQIRQIAGRDIPYIEGWCIAACREVWEALGGWNEKDFTGSYWEDNELCFRAIIKGYKLREVNWPIWHFGNYTSRSTPGAYAHSALNQAIFTRKVEEYYASGNRRE